MARAPRPAARLLLLGLVAFLAPILPAGRGEAADDAPKIRTLSPTSAARGTAIEIVIEGTNLFPVEELKCSLTGVTATVLDGSNATKLKVRIVIAETVPAGVVQLGVKTKNGTVTTDRFSIRLRVPLVVKVKPDAVKRGGEYEMTIAGANFYLPGIDPKLTVDPPMTVVRGARSDDKTLLVKLTVPPEVTPGSHAIAIEMPDGKANASFTVLLSPPNATGVKPDSVQRGGESDVRVEGTDLAGAGSVSLAVPDSSIQIRNAAPPEAKGVALHLTVGPDARPGPRTLLLSSPDGVTTATLSIGLRPPALTGCSPVGAPRGTSVEVRLAGTDVPADAVVRIVPPDPTVKIEPGKSGAWRITSEATARPGPRMLCVTTGDGTAYVPFHVTLRAPTVGGVVPAEVEPGKPVDLRVEGQNLAGCAWSVAPADPDVTVAPGKSAERIVLTVKPGAKAGPRCLVARSEEGAAVAIVGIKGSAAGVPVVATATPSRIDRPSKATVTLTGMNLRGKGDKAPEVSIGGPGGASLPVEVVNSGPSELVVSVTTDAKTVVGAYVVVVKTEDGGAAIPVVVGATLPSIASSSPAHAVRPAKTTLALEGAGLVGPDGSAPTVVVAKADGSQPLSIAKVAATADRVSVELALGPDVQPGGYVVSVATADGGALAPFQVEGSPPRLKSIAPGRLGVPASQDFVLTGESLLNPDGKPPALQVTRTGSAADMTPFLVSADAASITFRVATKPGTLPGPHIVSVRTADGTSSVVFAVVAAAPPVVTSLDATSGNHPGTLLTLVRGTGLSGATEMTFVGRGLTATILQNTNDREIQVKIVAAPDAEPGPHAFTITAPGGTASSGAVLFTIK